MSSRTVATLLLIYGLVFPNTAVAVMSSTNYQIQWDSIGAGGSDTGSSATYQLRDSIGNLSIGTSSSSSYDLRAGYRQGVNDQLIAFTLLMQDNETQVAATSLSSTTVNVSSTSGYSAGDYVVIVENLGLNQVSAVGKVSSLTATAFVLDSLSTNGTTPTINGSGDFVYRLTTSATPTFGSISESVVSTTVLAWEITSVSQNGHTIYVYDSGNLSTPSGDIDDVSDGAVTAGSEEAGARSSDTTLAGSAFDTADTAITTSAQAIGTESSDVYGTRQFLTTKMSISSTTSGGTYTNTTSVIATGNF
ncbi:MAG: hypothetical protein AAB337_02515 [Patescibacteria group bacterium]